MKYKIAIVLIVGALLVATPLLGTAHAKENSFCKDQLAACLRNCGANASCATECHAEYRSCANGLAVRKICSFFDITYRLMGKPNTLSFCKI
ncbi:MAG TPA: hypothetical protein VI968_00610 [archaeon]|nr:hypothetical protein [archaeon]